MTKKVSTLEVRKRLGDLLNRVCLRHDQFIIERKGMPLAAMVPVEMLVQMEKLARMQWQEALGRKSTLTQEEADRLSNAAKHQVRKNKNK